MSRHKQIFIHISLPSATMITRPPPPPRMSDPGLSFTVCLNNRWRHLRYQTSDEKKILLAPVVRRQHDSSMAGQEWEESWLRLCHHVTVTSPSVILTLGCSDVNEGPLVPYVHTIWPPPCWGRAKAQRLVRRSGQGSRKTRQGTTRTTKERSCPRHGLTATLSLRSKFVSRYNTTNVTDDISGKWHATGTGKSRYKKSLSHNRLTHTLISSSCQNKIFYMSFIKIYIPSSSNVRSLSNLCFWSIMSSHVICMSFSSINSRL